MTLQHPAPGELPPIVFFGNDWYADNRTSSHHIARELARRTRVLYVDCPGLRPPRGTRRDLLRALRKLRSALTRPKRIDERLSVCTLFQFPLHHRPMVRRVNRWLVRVLLRSALRREGLEHPISWAMVPHVTAAFGQLGERLTVYYCIDDYAALPGVDTRAVEEMDRQLTATADIVFVASETLLQAKRAAGADAHLSPHGVDFDHFARAQAADLAVPADLAVLGRPTVGFFGLIERWIDLDLVAYLAREMPDVAFVLIGRVAVPDDERPTAVNLHYLGPRRYDDLPAYGRGFDVTIIPYRLTRQVLNANPLKLREYLAMGKPVVAVDTPEIARFADVVSIAHGPEEFRNAIRQALESPDGCRVRARMQRAAEVSWSRRVDEALAVVTAALRRRSGTDRSATT